MTNYPLEVKGQRLLALGASSAKSNIKRPRQKRGPVLIKAGRCGAFAETQIGLGSGAVSCDPAVLFRTLPLLRRGFASLVLKITRRSRRTAEATPRHRHQISGFFSESHLCGNERREGVREAGDGTGPPRTTTPPAATLVPALESLTRLPAPSGPLPFDVRTVSRRQAPVCSRRPINTRRGPSRDSRACTAKLLARFPGESRLTGTT